MRRSPMDSRPGDPEGLAIRTRDVIARGPAPLVLAPVPQGRRQASWAIAIVDGFNRRYVHPCRIAQRNDNHAATQFARESDGF